MLLDQAAQSFQQYAYAESIPHISSFPYRIISGTTEHDRAIDITLKDDLLIVGKDSIDRNLSCLDVWLKKQNEVYLVIDEAHHRFGVLVLSRWLSSLRSDHGTKIYNLFFQKWMNASYIIENLIFLKKRFLGVPGPR